MNRNVAGPFLCTYCGKNLGSTIEHVIPQCLFEDLSSPGIVKVPVCQKCNTDKSKYDDALRDLLAADIRTWEHPIAKEKFKKFVKATSTNRSEIGRAAVKSELVVPLTDPNGKLLGYFPAVTINRAKFDIVFSYIVRGLYFDLFKERMSGDFTITPRLVPAGKSITPLANLFQIIPQIGPVIVDEEVLIYRVYIDQNNPILTRWLFWFYNSVAIIVSTDPIPKNSYKRHLKKAS